MNIRKHEENEIQNSFIFFAYLLEIWWELMLKQTFKSILKSLNCIHHLFVRIIWNRKCSIFWAENVFMHYADCNLIRKVIFVDVDQSNENAFSLRNEKFKWFIILFLHFIVWACLKFVSWFFLKLENRSKLYEWIPWNDNVFHISY